MKKLIIPACLITVMAFFFTNCEGGLYGKLNDILDDNTDKNNNTIYEISIISHNNETGDSVTATPASGKHGDAITLEYAIADIHLFNSLEFSGTNNAIEQVETAGTGTTIYTLNAADATDGVITIDVYFTHTGSIPNPEITIETQPEANITVTEEAITESLTIAAGLSVEGTPDYQWYSSDTNSTTGNINPIDGATGTVFTIPTTLKAGEYYYFCEVSFTGAETVYSDIAAVTVKSPPPFASGSGSIDDPYIITTPRHLRNLSDLVNAGYNVSYNSTSTMVYYKLANDIDLGDIEWIPIGLGQTTTAKFYGNLDGGGYTIRGLKITSGTTGYRYGLFGYIGDVNSGNNPTVKNLNLVCNIKTTISCTGGIAGVSYGRIQNCSVSGTVEGSANYADYMQYVGGIVGSNWGIIENCYSSADVYGGWMYTGGIAGYANSSNGKSTSAIKNCYVAANITGVQDVGGIVGYNNSPGIYYCYVTGSVSGTDGVGGIVGKNSYGNKVENCAALISSLKILSGSYTTINRITADIAGFTTALANNYAFDGMLVKLSDDSDYDIGTKDSGTLGGIDVDQAALTTENFYTDTTKWNSQVWPFGDTAESPWKWVGGSSSYKLPVLYWQTTYPAMPQYLDGSN